MPGVVIDVDASDLIRAFDYVFDNTRRTMPEIINRGALVTLIGGQGVMGAMQRTMKAARATILAVPEKLVAGYVMNKHRGEKLNRAQVRELVHREYRRRVAAIAYTAKVGWNNAAIAFGGRGIGRHARGKGYASYGYGIPAKGDSLEATGVNATPAATLIGAIPLREAMQDTARDMVEYAGGKFDDITARAGLKHG